MNKSLEKSLKFIFGFSDKAFESIFLSETDNLGLNEICEISFVDCLANPCYEGLRKMCCRLTKSPFLLVDNNFNNCQVYPSLETEPFNENVFHHHATLYSILKCYNKLVSLEEKNYDESIVKMFQEMRQQFYNYVTSFSILDEHSILLPYFILDLIPKEWFNIAVNKLASGAHDEVKVFTLLLWNLAILISRTSLVSEYLTPLLNRYIELITFDGVRKLVQALPNWIPHTDGNIFQKTSHLGLIFGITPFYADVGMHKDLRQSINDEMPMKNSLFVLWAKFKEIIRIFLRQNTRQKTYQFLNKCISSNMKKVGILCDTNTVSGFGFVNNINAILQMLVEQIDLNKIDLYYLNCEACSDEMDNLGKVLCEETRVGVSNKDLINFSKQLNQERQAADTNFHTLCFYWAMASHHLSTTSAWNHCRENSRRLEGLSDERGRLLHYGTVNNISNSAPFKNALSELDESIKECTLTKTSFERVLMDVSYIESGLRFCEMMAKFIMKSYEGENLFPYLPQFIFENISEMMMIVLESGNVNLLNSFCCETLIDLTFFMVTNAKCFQSPYLVAKFVKVLTLIHRNVKNKKMHNLKLIFELSLMKHANLVHHLIEYFNFVEKTGQSTEFYEKFNIRFDISTLLGMHWEGKVVFRYCDIEVMLRFLNFISNDITYLMDDGIGNIRRLKDAQEKRKSMISSLSSNDHQLNVAEINRLEEMVRTDFVFVNSYVNLILKLSELCAQLFTKEEIVHKFISMLNHFICDLVGPTYQDLNIENRKQCFFDPLNLFSMFRKIYLNLSSEDLIAKVSEEERYFSEDNLNYINNIITEKKCFNSYENEQFKWMIKNVLDKKKQKMMEEIDLDDAPFEYLDPIMNTIMVDPVLIPKSNITIDRMIIQRHLLNDPCDPFTRQPLTIDDLIPQTELKAEIEKWIENKRANRR